jgi:protein-L-isoaspartate(D-aspartate) O-methyltransferase
MNPDGSGTTSTDGEENRYAKRRARMVERQLRRRGIGDERVLRAMGQVPRELFVPEDLRGQAYRDGALRIEEGQTISQPWIVACMAELLELKGDERVLEVGTGSGYAAAVLAHLCAELVTIERHPALASAARERLERLGLDKVEVRSGDGTQGAPDRAPFQGISVTATAAAEPPPQLVEQLAPGGTLVCPVERGGRELLMRFREGQEEPVAPVRFVPLVPESEE